MSFLFSLRRSGGFWSTSTGRVLRMRAEIIRLYSDEDQRRFVLWDPRRPYPTPCKHQARHAWREAAAAAERRDVQMKHRLLIKLQPSSSDFSFEPEPESLQLHILHSVIRMNFFGAANTL